MRIAVDAMGGDFAPSAIVKGAIVAAKELENIANIILVGDEQAIRNEFEQSELPAKISIFHASETIGM
ncbi:MAG: phosphate acyltransferase, partial [Lentisphaerae bacterium]|nr:phosphate acyltransferase [Lentisphaerota bacterium]